MEKLDRLIAMYDYAVKNGLCTNRKSFAECVGINPTNISKIFHDENGRYLTNNLLLRINTALGDVFNPAWVLYGTGEMLKESAGADIVIDNSHSHHNNSNAGSGTQIIGGNDDAWKKVVADKDEQIAYLKQQIEELKQQIAELRADKDKLYQLLLK